MSPPGRDERLVDAATLRRLYADLRIEERIARGDLVGHVRPKTEHPAPPRAGEPTGTVSHIVVYVDDDGRAVALVHEYLRPDGTIGASGRRDPKWLRDGAQVWKLLKE